MIIDLVNYVTGRKNVLAPLAGYCTSAGVALLVDAVQGIGAACFDAPLQDVTALACGGHKWLRAPEGTGFLYVNPQFVPHLRSSRRGYRSLIDPSRFEIELGTAVFPSRATQLEVGTLNTLGFVGLAAPLAVLLRREMPSVAQAVEAGTRSIMAVLSRFPDVVLVTPTAESARAGIVTFSHRRQPSPEIVARLRHAKLTVGMRRGMVRLSAASDADFDSVCGRLEEVLSHLTSSS